MPSPEGLRPPYLPHNDSLVVSPPVEAPEAHTAPDNASLIDADKIQASAERKQQMLDMLQQGTEELLDSESFAAYLKMMSSFHQYSWQNTLLILRQYPEATKVNSYDRWQELGRQVMKGEQGIRIFYPKFRWIEGNDPDTGDPMRFKVLSGFGIGSVFDIEQTEGDPLPEEPEAPPPLNGSSETAKQVNLKLSRFLQNENVTCESKVFPGDAGGYWLAPQKKIVIRRGEGDPLDIPRTRTLAHEAAHFLADHRGNIPREDAETVAESAAFVTLSHFGINTGPTSFRYVAEWAQNKDVFRRNLTEVQKTANALITGIEGVKDPYHDPLAED